MKTLSKIGFEFLLALYIAVGIYGVLWLTVDFDDFKIALITFLGLPLAIVYYALHFLYFGWEIKFPKYYRYYMASLALIFGLGHFLLINAYTTETPQFKRSVLINGKVMTLSMKRGGLGVIYAERW